MEIHGLQKMTLLDFPGLVACTVFLGGCDLRCPFCHNFEMVDGSLPAQMDHTELLAFLEKRRGMLDGVCVSGGEPLLRRDLKELISGIRGLGFKVKLDTNGTRPRALEELLREGLVDYVAMDIKNSPERYGETVGIDNFDTAPVKESVKLLMEGAVDYEFRTTVVRQFHDQESFISIGQWLAGAKKYFLQSFTDRETVPFAGLSAPTREELETYADILRPTIPAVEIRGE